MAQKGTVIKMEDTAKAIRDTYTRIKTSDYSITQKRIRPYDIVLKVLIYLSAVITVGMLVGMLAYILVKGIPNINWEILSTQPSALKKTYGILPNIINTLYIIVLSIIIATPIGIGAAIYLNEYAKKGRLVRLIEFTAESLSGIPSIIYGLFGFTFFGIMMKLSYSIWSGALTLTIMILPIIIRTTQEALKTVPELYREGALGIGATKWYMIRTIILPCSLPGIITSVILSIGRIVGESAALIFTAGIGTNLPNGLFSHLSTSGATLSVQLYQYAGKGYNDISFAIAAVLIIVVFLINLLTRLIQNRLQRKK